MNETVSRLIQRSDAEREIVASDPGELIDLDSIRASSRANQFRAIKHVHMLVFGISNWTSDCDPPTCRKDRLARFLSCWQWIDEIGFAEIMIILGTAGQA